MTTAATELDVVIVGGGPVGAALANQLLCDAGLQAGKVLLLEPQSPVPPALGTPFDLRVSAWSPASRALLQQCGAWQRLDMARVCPYGQMRVWHEGQSAQSASALRFEAAALAEPDLGAIIENRAVQAALLAAYEARGGQLSRARVTGMTQDAGAVHLQLQDDTGSRYLQCRLVVAADGAASPLRGWAGIEVQQRSYGQQAIVATVRSELPHQHTAWQVFLDSGPLALLPLANGECSLVWSAVDARAESLKALSGAEFNEALTRASGGALGSLALASERRSVALQRLTATRYVAGRCVLLGDAAHVIHPLAGQGVNQGLLDVVALLRALRARPRGEDIAAPRVLRAYERERKAGNARMGAVVDQLDGWFTAAPGPMGRLAREGLEVVARNAWLRSLFARQAIGT